MMENKNINANDKRILFLLLFLPCLLIRRVLDNDTWFLLNSGRYVMEHGIPYIEPFSIHKNMEFVMQQWLTDVVFWNVYNKFGENGLYLIIFLCYGIIIFLMYKLTMKVSQGNIFVSFIVTLLSSILVYTYMVARPTIFTLCIVMIELNLLENYALNRNINYLLSLPILSLLMINLHAALWPILFIIILPYLIDSFDFKIGSVYSEGYGCKYLMLIVALMVASAFLNPYGIDSMMYLVNSTGHPEMNNIIEIKPPSVNNFSGALVYIYIAIIVFTYAFYRKGNTKWRYILLTAGTIYMVLSSIRNITYFAICSLFPLSFFLKDFRFQENTFNNKTSIKILRYVLIVLIILIIFIINFNVKKDKTTYFKYLDLNNTIDYIYNTENTTNIILYTGFNEGALVQFRELSTYIDPRAEVYFKKHNNMDDIFDEYFCMQKGGVFYKKVLDKYNFTHLIVSRNDILYAYLAEDSDYDLIYSNERYNLYKRKNI